MYTEVTYKYIHTHTHTIKRSLVIYSESDILLGSRETEMWETDISVLVKLHSNVGDRQDTVARLSNKEGKTNAGAGWKGCCTEMLGLASLTRR